MNIIIFFLTNVNRKMIIEDTKNYIKYLREEKGKGIINMMKKIMTLVLVICFAVTGVSAHNFTDVTGHWAEEEIQYGFENGIAAGYTDGSFKPDGTVTRAEFLKMLIASVCENLEIDVSEYKDDSHWASMYYNFALQEGVLIILDDLEFDGVCPAVFEGENYDYPIKRWEMAYILYCLLVTVYGAPNNGGAEYADQAQTLAAYDENIDYVISNCIGLGLLQGDANGNFNASNNGTRAQALTIVNRVDKLTKEILGELTAATEAEEKLVNEKVKVYEEIPEGNPKVKVEMENGDSFVMELYPEYAPQTVANFVTLVKDGFYDGLKFHRVIEGFMAQGGDPNGDGTGGSEHNITGEFSLNGFEKNTLKHERGVVSMARGSYNNSASSQFFICFDNADFLDGSYAAFGKVIEGMEVVDSFLDKGLSVSSSGEISVPNEDIVMKSVTLVE